MNQQPLYKKHDPKGWVGGVSMGRSPYYGDKFFDGELMLRRVRLDNGGYDCNGTYMGYGLPLYWCASVDNEIDFLLRADDRHDAKSQVSALYPKAKFYR